MVLYFSSARSVIDDGDEYLLSSVRRCKANVIVVNTKQQFRWALGGRGHHG